MGPRFRSLLPLLPALMLAGCGGQNVEMTTRGPTKSLQICAAAGGSLQARGKAQRMMCVHPYADGGKSCSSKKDCRGRCLADAKDGELPRLGAPATGHCQPDDKLFGCHAEVDGGKSKGAVCID